MGELLSNYWVILAATVAASVLNGLLNHWDRKTGVGRWLGIALDVLSFLTPKDGKGTLKLPGLLTQTYYTEQDEPKK